MNFDELKTFLEVVEQGSMVAAATRLHVTPSTVTARINALESHLGCRILNRNKSGTEPTSAGFKLLRYAELMTQLERQARHELALPSGVVGICNVGMAYDLWRDIGSRFLETLKRDSPGVAAAMWPAETRQLQRWLDIGLIDLAFCYEARVGEGYTSRLLLEDRLILVSARRGDVPAIDEHYVYVDHGDEFRRQHAEAFVGTRPSTVTIASSDWALEYIRRHEARGYLPRRVAEPYLRQGVLHEVERAPAFTRAIHLVESVRVGDWGAWYESAVASVQGGGAMSGAVDLGDPATG